MEVVWKNDEMVIEDEAKKEQVMHQLKLMQKYARSKKKEIEELLNNEAVVTIICNFSQPES